MPPEPEKLAFHRCKAHTSDGELAYECWLIAKRGYWLWEPCWRRCLRSAAARPRSRICRWLAPRPMRPRVRRKLAPIFRFIICRPIGRKARCHRQNGPSSRANSLPRVTARPRRQRPKPRLQSELSLLLRLAQPNLHGKTGRFNGLAPEVALNHWVSTFPWRNRIPLCYQTCSRPLLNRRPEPETDGRFLPHPPFAALRLRAGQPGQGSGTERRRRYHRSRHGQSGPVDAPPCHREAEGDAGQASERPLLPLTPPHPLPPTPTGPFPPPVRRQTQPGDPDRGDAGLEGGLCQCRPGDHRAWGRGSLSQPELSDSCLWISDGRRRDPRGTLGADAAILPGGRAPHPPFDPPAPRHRGLLSPQFARQRREARPLPRSGGGREGTTGFSPLG